MPHLLSLIREDVATVLERDPAARSRLEVYLCYSGLHAVWFYRMQSLVVESQVFSAGALAFAGGAFSDRN